MNPKDASLQSFINFTNGTKPSTTKAEADSNDFSQSANKHLISQIKRLTDVEPQFLNKQGILMKLANTKNKEILREVLAENNRKGNFIRIYPSKGSDFYD